MKTSLEKGNTMTLYTEKFHDASDSLVKKFTWWGFNCAVKPLRRIQGLGISAAVIGDPELHETAIDLCRVAGGSGNCE